MPAPMSSLRYIVALEIFSKSQRKSPTESFFIGKLFFRPIADPAKFFRAVPCFHSDTLSRPRFFLSPAWEIPLKIFSSGKLFFRRHFSCYTLLPSRRPSHAILNGISVAGLRKNSKATMYRSGDMGRLEKTWPGRRSAEKTVSR